MVSGKAVVIDETVVAGEPDVADEAVDAVVDDDGEIVVILNSDPESEGPPGFYTMAYAL